MTEHGDDETVLREQVEAIVPPGYIPFDYDAGPAQFVNRNTFPLLFDMIDKLVQNANDGPFVLPDWRDRILPSEEAVDVDEIHSCQHQEATRPMTFRVISEPNGSRGND